MPPAEPKRGSSGRRNPLTLKIGVISVARSDFGILSPILREIRSSPDMSLLLYGAAAHLSNDFGHTISDFAREAFPVRAQIPAENRSDSPAGAVMVLNRIVAGLAAAWRKERPDILIITGDRFEMLGAATAAALFHIPVAHIHGGELMMGSLDESFRHAITKLSHLHFAATKAYARRLRQLGEEDWRVFVSGAPAIDNIAAHKLMSRRELRRVLDSDLKKPLLALIFHPPTLPYFGSDAELEHLLTSLNTFDGTIIALFAGADTGGRAVNERLRRWCSGHAGRRIVSHLSPPAYYSLLRHADALIGNSSSGIIEAPSFRLPVVNIGLRQAGRIRAANVIDVPATSAPMISAALRRALSGSFRARLRRLKSPYGAGRATWKILSAIRRAGKRRDLLMKKFSDRECRSGKSEISFRTFPSKAKTKAP